MKTLNIFFPALLLCTFAPGLVVAQEAQPLTLNQPLTADLRPGGVHPYALDLVAGTFVFGEVNQISIDVVVKVVAPDGTQIAEFDNPARGPESFSFTTEQAGVYRLEIRPFLEDETGRYAVHLRRTEPVAATPEGRVDQLMVVYDKPDTPGVALAITQDGAILYEQGYGSANLEYDIPITPETIFHVASVSKQFTAFAVTMLAAEGALSLDDDVRKYIPEVPDFGKTITLRHLIHHTSGLRDQWNLLAIAGWRLDDVITKQHILKLISKQTELNFEPGAEMVYCNTGYTLLAETVARVTGEPFPAWTAENIFKPLGMTNTHFHDDHQMIVKNRAYSYAPSPNGGYQKSVLSYANVGATSLFTTVEDLALWTSNLQDGSTVGGRAVVDQMHEPGVLNDGETLSYAFGLGISTFRGLDFVGHSGGDAGFRSYAGRFPEQQFVVVILSNHASADPAGLARQVAEVYLSDDMEPPAAADSPAPPADETPTPSLTLTDFTGTYTSEELDTTYRLFVEGGHLIARHQRHPDLIFTPIAEDTFSTDVWFFGQVRFERDSEGVITGMRVSGSSGRVRNLLFERQGG
jgi:CubicO group peptidase (beta-lactamase class C family)